MFKDAPCSAEPESSVWTPTNRHASGVDRREFLSLMVRGSVGMALLGGGACSSPTLPPPANRPLLERPAEISSGSTLTARRGGTFVMGEGRTGEAWGYNGATPGPLLRVQRGEDLDITFQNDLPEETTVHWHGMLAPADMDGHPLDAVPPGASYRYRYPVVQGAATNWYHPHPHGRTGAQAALGLAGLLLIEDERAAGAGLPSGAADVPLVLRDARLDSANHLDYKREDWGFRGDFPLVNGVAYPRMEVGRHLHRLRLANASNSRVFRLRLDRGVPTVLIGTDGGLLEAPIEVDEITLGPAERVEVLADFANVASGARVALQCRTSGWDIIHFEVQGGRSESAPIPATLPASLRTPLGSAVREREFVFEGHHRINGRRYEMGRVDFTVPRGQTELWRFRSEGGAPHPVHVHGTHFRVMSRRGGRNRVLPWEMGLKDTVLIERGETVEVLTRFDHYPGIYMLHCHKLEHEDGGMMMDFRVD